MPGPPPPPRRHYIDRCIIAKGKSRWPYDARVIHARFGRDEILNLGGRRFARNQFLLHIHAHTAKIQGTFCVNHIAKDGTACCQYFLAKYIQLRSES